ncbi:hypothetical protein CALCODRAFT_293869 [Calocera cornea HHB12733]|uniref:CHAT domain-containing protein n=1 Tax=Calocera cornea HHB12733 TaxID=1353952 RepID=A0A165FRE9_9BASI|nr:hypothetical protein CALCODRAFT_293869 [Calocera cornea HHB12733]
MASSGTQSTSRQVEVQGWLRTYDRSATYGGLDEVLKLIDHALAEQEDAEHETWMRWQLLKASALRLRHMRDVRHSDLEEARNLTDTVLHNASPNTELHVLANYCMGRILEQRYDFTFNQWDLRHAVDFFFTARDQMIMDAEFGRDIAQDLKVHLGRSLGEQGLRFGSLEWQLESIQLLKSAIMELEDQDPLKFLALTAIALSRGRLNRYQPEGDSGEEEALRTAAPYIDEALRLSRNHPLRYVALFGQLYQKFRWAVITNESKHLEEGVRLGQQLISSIPKTHITHLGGQPIMTTAEIYFRKYERQGILEDLNESIRYQNLYLDTNPTAPHPYANLCESLCLRFVETNVAVDIDNAIRLGEHALEICAKDDVYPLFSHLYLGLAYARRYLWGEILDDEHKSEKHLGEAVRLAMARHPRYPDALAHSLEALVSLYCASFESRSQMWRSEEALSYMRMAVEHTHHPLYTPRRRSRLGECYMIRYALSKNPNDLTEAIQETHAAIETSTPGPEYHALLHRRSWALRLRFEVSHNMGDFEQSHRDLERALSLVVALNHPKQAFYQSELGLLYTLHFQHSADTRYLDEALSWYLRAATSWYSFSMSRFRAAITGAELAMDNKRYAAATEFYMASICTLRRVAWLGLNVSTRHSLLVRSASQLPGNGAAAAIKAGQLDKALTILEEGRSIMWRSTLELRADMTDLEEFDPGLARELMEIGKKLEYDDIGLQPVKAENTENLAQRRRRLAERFTSLIVQIRTRPGFERFLDETYTNEELSNATKQGPIIILNVSRYGSDALIIRHARPIVTIPLNGMEHQSVLEMARHLSQALKPARDGKGLRYLDQVLRDQCKRLWLGGIGAAVRRACDGWAGAGLPRCWLVPTGLLSLLPIHCAGIYEKNRNIGIQDFVIPSYTPTLTALLLARRRLRRSGPKDPRNVNMLAVGVTEVPRYRPLLSAAKEMAIISRLPVAGRITLRTGAEATVSRVKEDLSTHSWLHCCTHGSWNAGSPLSSAFQLHDGPLPLSAIMSLRVNGEFAFLSACHTARLSALLPDESMHLAAGMQIAGFQGVLGTVWGMADRDGPALTKMFYDRLLSDGRPLDTRNAAEALHHCIKQLQAHIPLCRWGAFVHFGV